MSPILMSRQKGAYLTLVAILLVVLIGISALAIDIGRVLSLRSEMQSAIDAAALAAAMELNGEADAIERAKKAARDLLEHDARFGRINALLGEGGLPDEAFEFFCVIGSSADVEPDVDDFGKFCSVGASEYEPNKYLALLPEEAHYVRVKMDGNIENVEEGRFETQLIFLPILNRYSTANDQSDYAPTIAQLKASALAGRAYYQCNFPPMALCDPFEHTGNIFRDVMPVGGHIQLKQQGSNQWSHGNFGFLVPGDDTGPGASDVAVYLADENQLGCEPPVITTKPGGMTNKTTAAINTRFDEYGPPAPFNSSNSHQNWPAAQNITEYPLDNNTTFVDSRFGLGDWDFENYWSINHPSEGIPNGWSNSAASRPLRWDVYNWEVENNSMPLESDPNHQYWGDYPPARSIPDRRLIHVAVLSCEALGITGGKTTGVVFQPDGFAKMFLTQKALGPPSSEIYAEYVGWSGRGDSNYHAEVQLYE